MEYLDIYEKWVNNPKIEQEDRKILESMGNDEISDAFYRNLEFGTAGLRDVAIAFDSRNHSQKFVLEYAKVLSENDIKVYLFDSLRSASTLPSTFERFCFPLCYVLVGRDCHNRILL